jgi:hypothetical protein
MSQSPTDTGDWVFNKTQTIPMSGPLADIDIS